MKKVLLTGATGYIGKFTIKPLLAKNYIVHAVSSKKPDDGFSENNRNLVWHQANLLSADETVELIETVRPTHLLHFAWFVEHGKFWDAPENLEWLNASRHLARCFGKNGGARMVSAGTCAEYDWTRQGVFSEKDLPAPTQTLYGKTKSESAADLEKLSSAFNFSFASGKIFFPFGEDEPSNRLIPSVIRALLENKPAATSHGSQIRDYMFVKDIAEAFAALLDSGACGAVNIASGKKTALKEIIETIAEIIGKPELLQIGAIPASQNETPEIIADVGRLRQEVKFNKELDIKKRLGETVEYWKRIFETTFR